jgi:predicted  nucleic acid-binding Zn-ribbon protein
MDSLQLLWIVGAAACGALAGAALCFVVMSRVVDELRQRGERAEQARNGALERSAQAREQIAQLNKAIDELRRSHSKPAARSEAAAPSVRERRAAAERALDAAHASGSALRQVRQVFADTEVLPDKA